MVSPLGMQADVDIAQAAAEQAAKAAEEEAMCFSLNYVFQERREGETEARP